MDNTVEFNDYIFVDKQENNGKGRSHRKLGMEDMYIDTIGTDQKIKRLFIYCLSLSLHRILFSRQRQVVTHVRSVNRIISPFSGRRVIGKSRHDCIVNENLGYALQKLHL